MMRLILLALAVVSFLSCTKDPVETKKSEYELRRFTEFSNGQTSTDLQLQDQGTNINVEVEALSENTVIWIGKTKADGTPRFTVSIVFKNQTDPSKIAGVYRFPDDLEKVDVFFTENFSASQTTIKSYPRAGGVSINYDPVTRTWRGSLDDVEYGAPMGAEYTRQVVSGNFSWASLKR